MATAEDLKRSRRRANLAGQIVAIVVALGGLIIVVAPALWTAEARKVVLGNPFPGPEVAKSIETTKPDGTRTVETTWEDQSALDRSLAGGGAVLLRIGIVAAASFLAGAAAQRASLAHFALELGPIKVPELPNTAEASLEAVVALTASIDDQGVLFEKSGLATERAILGLTTEQLSLRDAQVSLREEQVSQRAELARTSQDLREDAHRQRRDLDDLRALVERGQ